MHRANAAGYILQDRCATCFLTRGYVHAHECFLIILHISAFVFQAFCSYQ